MIKHQLLKNLHKKEVMLITWKTFQILSRKFLIYFIRFFFTYNTFFLRKCHNIGFSFLFVLVWPNYRSMMVEIIWLNDIIAVLMEKAFRWLMDTLFTLENKKNWYKFDTRKEYELRILKLPVIATKFCYYYYCSI